MTSRCFGSKELPLLGLGRLRRGSAGRLRSRGCQIFDLGISDTPTTFRSEPALDPSFLHGPGREPVRLGPCPTPGYNPDKEIETTFYTLNVQHQFNHRWGVEVAVPDWQRHFVTDVQRRRPGVTDQEAAGVSPNIRNAQVNTLSDVRIMGM